MVEVPDLAFPTVLRSADAHYGIWLTTTQRRRRRFAGKPNSSAMVPCLSNHLCFLSVVAAVAFFCPSSEAFQGLPSHFSQRQYQPHSSGFLQTLSDSSLFENVVVPKKIVIVAGATGYIGKAVVKESIRNGYHTVALVRSKASVHDKLRKQWKGADVIECNVTDAAEVLKTFRGIVSDTPGQIESIVSCLASRSGLKKDAYAIDYQATLNCLHAGMDCNARHFVMLSAFCVRNPWLQFQHAKLKFEEELQQQTKMTWSIVRPTAFFKSVSGQVENVQNGAPFVIFEDGQVTKCNPISETDLANYMLDCIRLPSRENAILNIGGPDDPITTRTQGEMIFRAAGKDPYYLSAPLWVFDLCINAFQWLADNLDSEKWEDMAETARIGKYYAVEDMLTTSPDEKFGTITLQEHYEKIIREGQEFDPFFKNLKATVFIAKNLGGIAKAFQPVQSPPVHQTAEPGTETA